MPKEGGLVGTYGKFLYIGLAVTMIKECKPFFMNLLLPIGFISFTAFSLFFVSFIGFLCLSDPESAASVYPVKGLSKMSSSRQYEMFARVNVTMASILTTALMCMVVWIAFHVVRTFYAYVLPMLRDDMPFIEERVWVEYKDWRYAVPKRVA